MIEDYRYSKRDLDQAYKRGYHKSIAEFIEDIDEAGTYEERCKLREKWEQRKDVDNIK